MKNLLTCLMLFSCFCLSAQQTAMNSLYFKNLFLINPAEVGKGGKTQLHLSHRQQWVGLDGAPTTTWFSAQTQINRNLNFGARVNYDQIAFFERLQFDASLGYYLKIDASNELNFGLSLGMIQGNLVMENMIATDYSDLLLQNNGVNGIGFHSDFGIVYTNKKKLSIGFAYPQLFSSPIALESVNETEQYDFKSHRYLYASYQLDMTEGLTFTPIIMLRKATGHQNQFDLLGNFKFKSKYWGGLGVRQEGGFLVNLGFSPMDNLKITYGYEFNNGTISYYSSGSHEVMVSFTINKNKDTAPTDLDQEDQETKE